MHLIQAPRSSPQLVRRIGLVGLLSLTIIFACKGSAGSSSTKGGSAASTAVGSGSGSGSGSSNLLAPEVAATLRTSPATAALTPERRRAYLGHLQEGQKLAKAKRWQPAIAAFEAAVKILPGDDRALSELSFAALSFGDFVKARDAGERSVLAASGTNVKAASLYNLGRVEEANDKLPQAAHFYRASLLLRDNKIVRERLAKVAKNAAPEQPDPPLCSAAPMSQAALCACIAKHAEFTGGECTVEDQSEPFVVISAETSDRGESVRLLAVQNQDKYQVVAHLGDVYNPGMMGISEDWELGKVEQQQVGDRTVVRFASTHSRQDSDLGLNEIEFNVREQFTFCVVAVGAPVTCPLQLTGRLAYTRETLLDDEEVEPELKKLQTKGLPIRQEYSVTATLTPQGVVQIRTAKGNPDPSLLGDKTLF